MDCLEFRRRLGAEPQSRDPALLAHRDHCGACAMAWERAQRFEQDLMSALARPVPEGLAERALLRQTTGTRQRTRRWRAGFAIAASLLVVAIGAGLAWRAIDARSLPALAVAHMPDEIGSLDLTRPITRQSVAAGFAGRGLALNGPVPLGTTYVHDCEVGPYRAVHLVTRRDDEPVVVLYFPHKAVDARHDFEREGWHGRELPLDSGSLVMLTDRGGTAPFDAIAHDWRMAIEGAHRARRAPLAP